MLIKNTYAAPISTAMENRTLAKPTKDNKATMSLTIQTQDTEIARIMMELEQSRKQIIAPIINTFPFDNFLTCTESIEEKLHTMQSKLYTKVADFIYFFFKFLSVCGRR